VIDRLYTVGIDVGSNSIKTVLMEHDDDGSNAKLLFMDLSKIRKRDTKDVAQLSFEHVLSKANLTAADIAYVATTGEGDMVDFRRGHFYSMTAHSRGAVFLNPDIRAVIDGGAMHGKAFAIDERSKVLNYKMTSHALQAPVSFSKTSRGISASRSRTSVRCPYNRRRRKWSPVSAPSLRKPTSSTW